MRNEEKMVMLPRDLIDRWRHGGLTHTDSAEIQRIMDSEPEIPSLGLGLEKRLSSILSASADPSAAKQETREEMRIRHKREFDALDDSGFHYQECRCGAQGSYPLEVKHCICGKPFASAEPSAPCTTPSGQRCPGDGVSECKACPGAPVEIDERAEFEVWAQNKGWLPHQLKQRPDGDYEDWGVNPEWQAWKARAALERKP